MLLSKEASVATESDVYEQIKRLQTGERIRCPDCEKGYYITSAIDVSLSREFYCSNCGSVIKIIPDIIVN